ncbi:MAG TPA: hypothetical protein DCZ51_01490 [Bacteroidales bacterium]|nr:hypothetical protein [Bacteroidales bacterium]
MKKFLLVLSAIFLIISNPVDSQGLLNKVRKAVSKEISGVINEDSGTNTSKPGPEPACACDDAKMILDLAKYKIAYNEFTICTKDDGSMLVYDKMGSKYYIVKDGVSEGPYKEGDPIIQGFCSDSNDSGNDEKADAWVKKYPGFISRSGDKYLIKFGGKNYGPYAMISDFALSNSKSKFAAIVTENMFITEAQGRKMEEAMKNAKTDQERMDIAMSMSQNAQSQMMKDGGKSLQPQLITNVPGATFDVATWLGGKLNGTAKFDDLVVIAPDRIMDMTGKTTIKLPQNSYDSKGMFLNTSGTKYAMYNSGALTFSDNTTLAEVFNPYMAKTDGKVFLTYMYYSPGKNAVMQCAIPF